MNSMNLIIMSLGMMLVTYIPRALPAIFTDKLKFNKKTEKFLKLIPYTAMAALIFPGVFISDANNPVIGIVGCLAAVVPALKKCPVMVCVLTAIGADFILYLFI